MELGESDKDSANTSTIQIKVETLRNLVKEGLISETQKDRIIEGSTHIEGKSCHLSRNSNLNLASYSQSSKSNLIVHKSNLVYLNNHKDETDINTLIRLYSSIQQILEFDSSTLPDIKSLELCLFAGFHSEAKFECISVWSLLIQYLHKEIEIYYKKLWNIIVNDLALTSMAKFSELFIQELSSDDFYPPFIEAIKLKANRNHIFILQVYINKHINTTSDLWIYCLNLLRIHIADIGLFQSISCDILKLIPSSQLKILFDKYLPEEFELLFNLIIQSSNYKIPESVGFTGQITLPEGSITAKFDHLLKESQHFYDLMEFELIKENVINDSSSNRLMDDM